MFAGINAALQVRATEDWLLANTGPTPVECLVLQGRPIGEPVAQYGPFVMNDKAGIIQAMEDYQYGRFGQIPDDALQPFHHRH